MIQVEKSALYMDFYDRYLSKYRNEPLNFLEVGVLNGGSSLMFAEYFPNARILCIDIKRPPEKLFECIESCGLEDRVTVEIGSQDDLEFLDKVIRQHFGEDSIDLVCDDASHIEKFTRATFDHVFPKYLKSAGMYIVEDWGCGYWPKWIDGNADGMHGLAKFVKEMVDEVALFDRTKLWRGERTLPVDTEQDSDIVEMLVTPGIIAMIKR